MEDFVMKCKVKNNHEAFAFIDKTGTKKLPSPEFLAMFKIVITTSQRFTNEWKNGSFEAELKRKSKAESQNEFRFRDSTTTSEESCPLLKVNWLRMVVDEGHSMGKGKDNSAICFASWISAERRWAMTGTPTRQTASQTGLSNILGLMRYLQHDFFSRRREGENVWQNMIARNWNHGHLSAFARLRSLLSLLMVRHTKMDIEELPPPHFRTSVLPMSYEEVTTYNTLVCAVQSNLLITSMEGKTSGAQDSLLHRSQAKHAKDALRNVRLVCSGGTRVIPTLSQIFWNEFIADMSAFTPPEHKMTEMKRYLHRAVIEQLSPCNCCGMMLSTLLVYPCGDLVCTECADHRSNCCVVCDKDFSVDDFQRLQPGMDYQWLHNIEEELKKKKVDVAAAANEGDENPSDPSAPDHDIFLAHGAGNLVPLDPERQRRRTRKFGDGHTCEYDKKCTSGECTLCWKEHDICNLLNRFSRCQICFRTAETCPESESKSSYIIDRLLKLCNTQQEEEYRRYSRTASLTIGEDVAFKATRKLKVIVFSQFRKVLNMIGDRLLRRFGTASVAEYWGKFRKQELHKFIYSDECFCMLLGKDGSEGLDLSFVTHIFFIEQVWDKSLEHQAVARAWRMGAKGSVEVETLIAENSVEETMRKLEHNLEHRNHHTASVGNPDDFGKNADYQRAKLQFLLKGLELIKNSYTLNFRGNKRKVEVAEEVASTLVASLFATRKKAKGSRVRFKL
jgi:SNF2 family DNA or RNA helicase